ncbi:MAG: tetrahydrofolate dehydrogenase/cyclohydrolase catalytic domain-containing protein [Bacteroidota bacterium]
MSMLLDGKAVAQAVRQELAQQVKAHKNKGSRAPHLAIILIGHDPASHIYVNNKIKACHEVGFQSTLIQKEYIEEEALLQLIQQINENETIDGLIVQLPLPQHINVQKVLNHIKPEKDVDGLVIFINAMGSSTGSCL